MIMSGEVIKHMEGFNDASVALLNGTAGINGIEKACWEIASTKGRIFTAGNGGSSATASHVAQDFSKMAGLQSICLTDNVPSLTAWSNDESYEEALEKIFLSHRPSRSDLLVVFSGSGNSENILRVLATAVERKITTIAFLGYGGGAASIVSHIQIVVDSCNMQVCEDVHSCVAHGIVCAVSNFLKDNKTMPKPTSLLEALTEFGFVIQDPATTPIEMTVSEHAALLKFLNDEVVAATPPGGPTILGFPLVVT